MSETIGERLKRVRAEQHLTLEQAAHTTKIKVHYLEALENDQPEVIPSTVQGKGFLRLYADYLGLNVEPLLNAWANNSVIQEEPPALPTTDQLPPPPLNNNVEEISPEPAMPIPASSEKESQIPPEGQDKIPKQQTLSDEIFRRIGRDLQKRREILGLSLEDVERYILVRKHYLAALENGSIEDLPSLVQGRGMLNNYAHFLEMDTEKVLLVYADALQQRRIESQNFQEDTKKSFLRRRSMKARGWRFLITPDLIIGGLLIIGLVSFALWGISQITSIKAAGDEPASLALPESLLTPHQPTLTTSPTGAIPTRNPEESLPIQVEETAVPATPTGFSSLAPLQLNIVANQRAYLRIISDGKTVFNGRVAPGNAYSFSGEKQIELITGNAGAIQVYFNQKEIGILGIVGQVSKQIFTAGGMITPTAQFSPTPTETPQPTATLSPTPTMLTPTVTPFIP